MSTVDQPQNYGLKCRYYFSCISDGGVLYTDDKVEAMEWLSLHSNDLKEHIITLSEIQTIRLKRPVQNEPNT